MFFFLGGGGKIKGLGEKLPPVDETLAKDVHYSNGLQTKLMFAYMHTMSVISQDHSFVHIIHDGNVYSHFLSGDVRSKA